MHSHTLRRGLCALTFALGMYGLGRCLAQPACERWLSAHGLGRLQDVWMTLHLLPVLAAGGLRHWNEALFTSATLAQWALVGYIVGVALFPRASARSAAALRRG